MTGDPAFSVVMPAHDTASTVGAAVESVLRQSRRDFELLVVDDASTDGTADVVERYTSDRRVRLLRRRASGGPGAARNCAFDVARAPLVSMLDSDDLWLPGYLEAAGSTLAANPGAGLFCAGHWTLEEPPGLIRRDAPASRAPSVLDADTFLLELVERNFVANSTVTVRRSALAACGGCDPGLRSAVDLDLWLRLAAKGYGAVEIAEPLAVYRLRRGSIQHDPRNELLALRGLRSVYAALAENAGVAPSVRAVAGRRAAAIERSIERLASPGPEARAVRRARRAAGAVRDVVLKRRIWYHSVPPELARALPALAAHGGAG